MKFNLSDVDFAVREISKGLQGDVYLEGDTKKAPPTSDELDASLFRLLTNIVSQHKMYSINSSSPETLYAIEKCGSNVFFAEYHPVVSQLSVTRVDGKMWTYSNQASFAMKKEAVSTLSNSDSEVVLTKN